MGVDRADDHGVEAGAGRTVGDRRSRGLRSPGRRERDLLPERTGCQWRYLPHDLPAWSTVLYYFTLWREGGLDQQIQELLRCQVREREKTRR